MNTTSEASDYYIRRALIDARKFALAAIEGKARPVTAERLANTVDELLGQDGVSADRRDNYDNVQTRLGSAMRDEYEHEGQQ